MVIIHRLYCTRKTSTILEIGQKSGIDEPANDGFGAMRMLHSRYPAGVRPGDTRNCGEEHGLAVGSWQSASLLSVQFRTRYLPGLEEK